MSWTPSQWEHFYIEELTCRCGCGRMEIAPQFMETVVMARIMFDRPMLVTSGYRCPEHDAALGGAGNHTVGALDFMTYLGDAKRFLKLCSGLFSGLGIKQHGPFAGRFIHIDNMPDGPGRPRPTVWSYP